MKATLALWKREYLEHRGAFLYAPAALLALFSIAVFGTLASNRWQAQGEFVFTTTLKAYEVSLFVAAGLWWLYLMAALFFYFADAFSADGRNNAMLFWKSMPLSDLRILGTKFLAGLLVFPTLILAFGAATGLLLYLAITLAATVMPGLLLSGPADMLAAFGRIGLFALVSLGLSLLWFAPFYAWLGALSTVFRRWCMPLAFLIPGVLILFENLLVRGGPPGGYLGSFLRERLQFGFHGNELQIVLFSDRPVDTMPLIATLVAGIDWLQLGLGLVVAALLVFLASVYRRRVLEK